MHGFTIHETLTVILIISILFSIAIPSFLVVVEEAKCKLGSNSSIHGRDMVEISNSNSTIRVNRNNLISGKIKGCEPFGKVLMFYVKASGKASNQYYYFNITVNGKNWRSDVIFGAIEDGGTSFAGGCVLVDRQDSRLDEKDSDNGIDIFIGKPVSMEKTFVRQ